MKINVVRKQGNQVSCAFLEFLYTHEKLPSLSYYFKNNRNSLCERNVCSVNNNILVRSGSYFVLLPAQLQFFNFIPSISYFVKYNSYVQNKTVTKIDCNV